MRKSARAVALVITSLIATVGLWIASAFAAALAFGAMALIVPGTGTRGVENLPRYMDNAGTRFIDPAGVDVCDTEGVCNVEGVDYPASFWPIPLPGWCPNLTCDTWNQSVGTGVANLHTEVVNNLPTEPGDELVIFGYSQGGAVVSREMYRLMELDPEIRDRISVVTIGNINNPQGLWSRLSFLRYIPILDVSFGPQLPTEGIKSTNYSFEYDPVGDAPLYWGNPLAVLNALMAFEYVHGEYLVPNENSDAAMPYGYDDETLQDAIDNAKHWQYQDATFVIIPQQGTLPIFMPFVDLGNATGTSAFIDPVVRLLQPVTKLLIDLGYDRTANPGVPRTLSILPFNPLTFNPIEFSIDFVEAVLQGIHDAVNGRTVAIPAPPAAETDDALAGGAFARLASDEVTESDDDTEASADQTETLAPVVDLGQTADGVTTVTDLEDEGAVDGDTAIDDTVKEDDLDGDVVVDGTDTTEEGTAEDADEALEEDVVEDETALGEATEGEDAEDQQQDDAESTDADDVDKDEPAADAANDEAPAAA